ncbi:MAG: hypothetical protein JW723_02520 [Bacteroidales bacterium]|nr:hypothetical protein [Bacteroidales bacterium]
MNANLSSLKINGISVNNFIKDLLEYSIELEPGTSEIPEIEAVAEDSSAQITITKPPLLPGIATVKVIAKD